MKDSLVKRFLRENKPLISYVRDKKGFRKGVVVGCRIDGRNRIGWSLVAKEDYSVYRGKPADVPRVRKILSFLHEDDSNMLEHVINDAIAIEANAGFFQYGTMSQPDFNREEGLRIAIDRLLQDDDDEKEFALPSDKDLLAAVNNMIVRSQRYYKEEAK